MLKGELPHKNIGTIHNFQGAEFLVIIFSCVVFRKEDSAFFIDRQPNLLNVAISRAKELFIMVGSEERLKNTHYFGIAIDYIKQNGLFTRASEWESDRQSAN